MNETKENAKEALKELFEIYKDKGVLATYLYGSITTSDFDPNQSDIDSIALADSNTPAELDAEMNVFLKSRFPKIEKFKVRLLYVDELKRLDRKPGSLTFFIYPQSLLLDFPYWEFVAGTKFDRNQFPELSYEDGLTALIGVLDQWNWRDIRNVSEKKVENYLKVLARIIWVLHGIDGQMYPFSYSQLVTHDGSYKKIAQLIFDIKKDGWSSRLFVPNKDVFQCFVDEVLTRN